MKSQVQSFVVSLDYSQHVISTASTESKHHKEIKREEQRRSTGKLVSKCLQALSLFLHEDIKNMESKNKKAEVENNNVSSLNFSFGSRDTKEEHQKR